MDYICDKRRHLICTPYSIENLHKMAEDLRINRCWFHPGRHPHYDIPKKRIHEVTSKCKVVSTKDILNIINSALLPS